jgi:hypothetical protein
MLKTIIKRSVLIFITMPLGILAILICGIAIKMFSSHTDNNVSTSKVLLNFFKYNWDAAK